MKKQLPWLLAAFFVWAVLPMVSSMLTFHPDERHYSEAAMQMMSSGDYMTPRYMDGSLRLIKPPLTYWVVVAGYQVFGISALGLRVGFLLAAGFIVVMTYRLGRDMCRHELAGTIAALIMLSNPQFIMAAYRANPDMLLALFMLISADGFLRIMLRDRPSRLSYWEAYGGAGLAALTKGMLPLLFVAYAVVFIVVREKSGGVRKLVHIPSMLVGLVLAVGWQVWMVHIHGSVALHAFWNDQVGQKVTTAWWRMVAGPPLFAAAYIPNLLPWSLVAMLIAWRQKAFITGSQQTPVFRKVQPFVLVWVAIGSLIFGLNRYINMRYLLPFIPLLAVWLGAVIARADMEIRKAVMRDTLIIVTVVAVLLATLIAGIYWLLGQSMWGILSLLVVILIYGGIVLLEKGNNWMTGCKAMAVGMLMFAPVFSLVLAPAVLPEIGSKLVGVLQEVVDVDRPNPVICLTGDHAAAKIKIASHGRWQPVWVPPGGAIPDLTPDTIFIVSQERLYEFPADLTDYSWRRVIKKGHYRGKELMQAISEGELADYLDTHGQSVWVGIPNALSTR